MLLAGSWAAIGMAWNRRAAEQDRPTGRPNDGRVTVTGVIDIVSMDMNDFVAALGNEKGSDRLVLMLTRNGQASVLCRFPPGSARGPLTNLQRFTLVEVRGRVESSEPAILTLTDCELVSRPR